METLALYIPLKLATWFDRWSTTPEKREGFLDDLVIFADEEDMDRYLASFRDGD